MTRPREDFIADLQCGLAGWQERGLRRELSALRGVDFSSNDYLGLSRHPRLRARLLKAMESEPVSAPASRLLRGNLPVFRQLEDRFARFKGAEAGLLFPSGYQANLGLLSTLIRPEDRVLSDALNHASIIDGLRLSRAAKEIYPHLDLQALEALLAEPRAGGRTFVVTESFFSMEGDIAPLDRIAALARRYGALLIVDEAHATGLYGKARGSGLVEEFQVEDEVLAAVSTCGKALGLAGAVVTGPHAVIEHLINHSRPFIFSTAPLPILAVGILAALDVLADEPWRREQARERAKRLRSQLQRRGAPGPDGDGVIVPIPIGDNHRALEVALRVRDAGYDVRALRPPSVPEGMARLRVSVHASHTDDEIDGAAEAIAAALRRAPPGRGR
jgi:8-amino-7-oxononanoate synthase